VPAVTSILRRILLPACVAALLVAAAPAAAQGGNCAGASAVPGSASPSTIKSVVLCLLNQERARHGLSPLHANGGLERAARRHSHDMVAHRIFSHRSSNGSDFSSRIRHAGYLKHARSWSVGENIGWGGGSLASARAMVDMWMHSPGHRANILAPGFHDIGIGVVNGAPVGGANQAATYTTDFGRLG
jgi:uncharacterized protein YkwD